MQVTRRSMTSAIAISLTQWPGSRPPVMAATIERLFNPKSVIDVGCGAGTLLAQLKQDGVVSGNPGAAVREPFSSSSSKSAIVLVGGNSLKKRQLVSEI